MKRSVQKTLTFGINTEPNLHILLLLSLNAKLKIWRHHKETQAFKLSLNRPMFVTRCCVQYYFFQVQHLFSR